MKSPHAIVWLLTTFSLVCGNIVYLRRQRNNSVELTCVSSHVGMTPFAFTLNREWVQPQSKVLYYNFKSAPSISLEKQRVSVRKENGGQRVNISISQLKSHDSDLYSCVFHYDQGIDYQNFPGTVRYFLHVEGFVDEVCSCYSYEPLLFALSAAAGLLFLCVLVFIAVRCKKPSGSPKPQPTVPIYEEMSRVPSTNGKYSSFHPQGGHFGELDEPDVSLYVQPRKENPYVTP